MVASIRALACSRCCLIFTLVTAIVIVADSTIEAIALPVLFLHASIVSFSCAASTTVSSPAQFENRLSGTNSCEDSSACRTCFAFKTACILTMPRAAVAIPHRLNGPCVDCVSVSSRREGLAGCALIVSTLVVPRRSSRDASCDRLAGR